MKKKQLATDMMLKECILIRGNELKLNPYSNPEK